MAPHDICSPRDKELGDTKHARVGLGEVFDAAVDGYDDQVGGSSCPVNCDPRCRRFPGHDARRGAGDQSCSGGVEGEHCDADALDRDQHRRLSDDTVRSRTDSGESVACQSVERLDHTFRTGVAGVIVGQDEHIEPGGRQQACSRWFGDEDVRIR